jgi:hypothetical protein
MRAQFIEDRLGLFALAPLHQYPFDNVAKLPGLVRKPEALAFILALDI